MTTSGNFTKRKTRRAANRVAYWYLLLSGERRVRQLDVVGWFIWAHENALCNLEELARDLEALKAYEIESAAFLEKAAKVVAAVRAAGSDPHVEAEEEDDKYDW